MASHCCLWTQMEELKDQTQTTTDRPAITLPTEYHDHNHECTLLPILIETKDSDLNYCSYEMDQEAMKFRWAEW